uniref:Putative actin-related protein n=1 Tax=uncultured organism TaxID=155900 RepID=A0A0F6PX50_9ZZZZ|nr:putative actin-related protein [uncultured organism]
MGVQILMSAIQNYVKEASKKLSDTGKRTGLMVKLGEQESYIVPIFETFVVNRAITNFEITGEVIAKYFRRLGQQEGGMRSSGPKITEKLRKARNKLVYVALDPDKEPARIKEKNASIERSGMGTIIRESHYMASEGIFKPGLVGKDCEALDEAIISVLSLCEVNFRRGLCNNIMIYGSAVLRGLSERLQFEIQKKFQGKVEVNVSSL